MIFDFRIIRTLIVSIIWALSTYAENTQFTNPPDENGERSIVIVTASYNNKDWYKMNLDSIFLQNYKNFRLVYIDDCSSDGTGDLVETYIKQKGQDSRVTLVKNKQHRGALANHYTAITKCNDNDIIVIVDGDDFLAHSNVLNYINNVYAQNNIWLTYGQFVEYPSKEPGFCCEMPHKVRKERSFREYGHTPSHLRTFYAGLFKQIQKEDLMYKGDFFEMDADIAAMFPMIEMASDHFKFIRDVLYVYNSANVLNDHKKSKDLQRELDLIIRSRPRYEKVNSPVPPQK